MNKENLEFLNKYVKGKWNTIGCSNMINVEGDVNFSNTGANIIIPDFYKVTGNFDCSYNRLASLKGSPLFVGGNFDCSYNEGLKKLDLYHTQVEGDFICSSSEISSLSGLPRKVKGTIWINDSPIVSVEGIQNTEFNDIKFNYRNKGSLSKKTLDLLIKKTIEYKEYSYILPLVLSLSEIEDEEDLNKILDYQTSYYSNTEQEEKIAFIIVEVYKEKGKDLTKFSKFLKNSSKGVYEHINKKIGDSLKINNDLLDLGF